jgi:hypothetical protein
MKQRKPVDRLNLSLSSSVNKIRPLRELQTVVSELCAINNCVTWWEFTAFLGWK